MAAGEVGGRWRVAEDEEFYKGEDEYGERELAKEEGDEGVHFGDAMSGLGPFLIIHSLNTHVFMSIQKVNTKGLLLYS